jgi:AraC-like DNA-binding protein
MAADAGPRLYRPRAPLSRHVEYFGYWDRDAAGPHRSRALPRGAVTVVVDIGGRERIDFFAADGHTRLAVPPAFLAGAGTTSYITQMDARQAVMTIHFRPAGARPYVGAAVGEVENACVGLAELWGRAGAELPERLAGTPSPAGRVRLVEDFLLSRGRSSGSRHHALPAVLNAVERKPSIRMSELCELTGTSARSLIALFRAEVGMSPKAFARVRRFQAALRALDCGPVCGAAVAADLGYCDQPHLVREFRALAAMTPQQYRTRSVELPSHVGLETKKSKTAGRGTATMIG